MPFNGNSICRDVFIMCGIRRGRSLENEPSSEYGIDQISNNFSHMIILHPEEMHDMIEKKLEITNMRYTYLTQAACAGADSYVS